MLTCARLFDAFCLANFSLRLLICWFSYSLFACRFVSPSMNLWKTISITVSIRWLEKCDPLNTRNHKHTKYSNDAAVMLFTSFVLFFALCPQSNGSRAILVERLTLSNLQLFIKSVRFVCSFTCLFANNYSHILQSTHSHTHKHTYTQSAHNRNVN